SRKTLCPGCPNEVQRTKVRGSGKGKQRQKFTSDQLERLKQSFYQNPYPDFTTKEELARQIHCHVFVIDNWFQNKRARLPPRERQRIFANRKWHGFPVQGGNQDTQVQIPNSTTGQNIYAGEALPSRAGYSSLEMQGVPGNQDGSRNSFTFLTIYAFHQRFQFYCLVQVRHQEFGSKQRIYIYSLEFLCAQGASPTLLSCWPHLSRENLLQGFGYFLVT
uniref:Homeobox domain-containing protein n=1 Tax=Castor canadensis TaxID=51338 RepID=A0A8C0XET9_CASCN